MFKITSGVLVLFTTLISADTGIDYLNTLRTKAGLPPFKEQYQLTKAAQNHSDYLAYNNTSGHGEKSYHSGYTGRKSSQRAIYAGYNHGSVGENISYGDTPKESIDGLFSAIYHRFGFLSLERDEVGRGENKDKHTFNMGNSVLRQMCAGENYRGTSRSYYKVCADKSIKIDAYIYKHKADIIKHSSPKLVLWPPPYSDDIPPVFTEESPDPLPYYSISGYPVSVQFNDIYFSSPPKVIDFTLEDSRGNVIQMITRMNKDNDPNGRFSAYQHALFPVYRLDWESKYTAKLSYTYRGELFHKEWSFRTRNLDDIANKGYRVTQKNATYTIASGEKYIFYMVPRHENEKISNLAYQYSTKEPDLEYIDSNTFYIRVYGNKGNYVNITMQNGRKIKLKIRS